MTSPLRGVISKHMKKLVQSFINRLGYDVFKRDARCHAELCVAYLARDIGFTTVLDVGANTGQFGSALREWGYRGKILSFEPLSQAHAALLRQAQHDDSWQVAPRCAIGSKEETAQINISANSVSSSLLGISDKHVSSAPESKYVGTETVQVFPLDSIVPKLCDDEQTFFLKIDTQGFEESVLDGAGDTLGRCLAVQLELSLAQLYSSSFLFQDGLSRMKQEGFSVFSIYPGFSDRTTGQTLQVDVIFVRDSCSEPVK